MKTSLYSFVAAAFVLSGCEQSSKPNTNQFGEAEIGNMSAVVKYTNFSRTPAYIKKALDTVDGGDFLIASPGENWSPGCTREDGEPGKQLIWASVNDGYFLIAYKQGGIGLSQHILRLNFDGERLVSYSKDGKLFRWIAHELEK